VETLFSKGFYDERQAAKFLKVEPKTLQSWRFRGRGPPYCKFGKAVRYPVIGLENFARAGLKQAQVQEARHA
jgi:hypothetical protein